MHPGHYVIMDRNFGFSRRGDAVVTVEHGGRRARASYTVAAADDCGCTAKLLAGPRTITLPD